MINQLQAETMRNILLDTISKIEEVDVGLGKFSSMEEKTTMITKLKDICELTFEEARLSAEDQNNVINDNIAMKLLKKKLRREYDELRHDLSTFVEEREKKSESIERDINAYALEYEQLREPLQEAENYIENETKSYREKIEMKYSAKLDSLQKSLNEANEDLNSLRTSNLSTEAAFDEQVNALERELARIKTSLSEQRSNVQKNINEVKDKYCKEQKKCQELKLHFRRVDSNAEEELKEARIIQSRKDIEDRADEVLFSSAAKIQSIIRSKLARKHCKGIGKKKKKKPSKRTKKK